MPKADKTRALWPVLVVALVALAAGACSTSATNSGLTLVDAQGNHPANFLSTHPGFAVSSVAQCRSCHGSDLTGGIAKVSCFQNTAGCHHGTIPGWLSTPPAPQAHGQSAKRAPGSSGFVSCRICHGSDYSGGGAQVACLNAACHGDSGSPHPADWGVGDPYEHMDTAEQNASSCARCHAAGANSPIPAPDPAAPAGTAPGCFNSTLCHGAIVIPHPVGDAWVTTPPSAEPHGIDAKATPGDTSGFAYCQLCHGSGTDFAGGSAGVSCYPCHGTAGSPHPEQWLAGDPYFHSTTAPGNAAVCAFCHTAGANSPIAAPSPPAPAGTAPGCFNSTLCHGPISVPHAVGAAWVATPPAAQPHGGDAKAAPGATSGFGYCRACHGTSTGDFNGGVTSVSCRIVACHGGDSPHAAAWLPGDTYTHTTTDVGNAPECGFCHYGESSNGNHAPTPPPLGSGCFNNTLCHD